MLNHASQVEFRSALPRLNFKLTLHTSTFSTISLDRSSPPTFFFLLHDLYTATMDSRRVTRSSDQQSEKGKAPAKRAAPRPKAKTQASTTHGARKERDRRKEQEKEERERKLQQQF